MTRYDIIKKNIIFEDKINYKKDGKEYIGCLVKSKYSDESDRIEFDLFEIKTIRNLFLCLDLIEYEKVEEGGKTLRLFYFQLIPKHQQEKQIFACETEENRIKWIKILNENIVKLSANNNYELDSDDELMNNNIKPVIPPRTFIKPKPSSLNENNIFHRGTFNELHQILVNINKPGVYAVSKKTQPESDCILAIRVYENDHTPISSWNIYQNKKTNEYFLSENDLKFANIVDLCSYYTKNNLPNTINRLTLPFSFYINK